jgi:hypothetical protein
MSCSQAIRGKGVRRLMVLAISFAGGYPVTVLDSRSDRANDLGRMLIRPRTLIMNDVDSIVDRSESSGLAKMSMHEASPTADGNI